MAKIRMLKTTPVALDGIHTKLLTKDTIYPNECLGLSDDEMKMLVEDFAIAEYVAERRRPEPSEKQVVEPSETKDEDTDEEDDLEIDESEDGIEVHELAKKYQTTNRMIINAAKSLDIGATGTRSKLTATEAARIKQLLKIG